MKQHFTTREVAKILSLPEWRIRSCVRAGFLAPERGPDRRNVFSFHDLLLLRTTKGLLNAHVPLGRIRRILQSLKKQLPEDKKLWNVSVFADGKHVVVKNGAARWQPDSGQFLFNFAAQELAQKLNLPQRKKAPQPERSADDWFDLACDLESSRARPRSRSRRGARQSRPAPSRAGELRQGRGPLPRRDRKGPRIRARPFQFRRAAGGLPPAERSRRGLSQGARLRLHLRRRALQPRAHLRSGREKRRGVQAPLGGAEDLPGEKIIDQYRRVFLFFPPCLLSQNTLLRPQLRPMKGGGI